MFEGIRNFFSRLFGGGKKKEERPQVYTPPTMSLNKPTGHPLLDKNPLPLNNRADASSIFPKPQTPTPQSTAEGAEARFKPTEPKTEISLNPKPTTSPLATPRVHRRVLRDLSRDQRLMQERQNDTFARTITFDRGEAMRQKAQKARHQDFLNQRRNENLKKQLQSTFEPKFATTDLTPQARRYLREEYDKIVQRIDSGQVRDYGTDEQINRLYQSFTNRLQEVDQANKFAQRVYQSTGNINKAIQARDQQIESKRIANEEQQKYEALKNIGRTIKAPLTLLKGAIGGAGSVAHEGAATFHDIMASASDLLGAEDAKTRFRQSANIARQEASRARQFWGVEKDDNDHDFIYGLGSGGAQLAKDIALTSTGLGFIPVAERAAKTGSQTYLTNRDLGKGKLESLSRAFGNAALQAKLEKVGLDSLTNSIGNKLVRTGLAAASEAAQEGTQEAVDNAFNDRPLEENVLESAAAGLLLGTGAGVAMSKITSPQPHNQTRIESDVRNGIVNANTINLPVELRLETALNSTTINQDTNIKNFPNQDGKHENIKDWSYGEVRYEAPDPSKQQYSAVANVGVDSDGNRQLYTFDKIKKLPAQPESLKNRGVSYGSNMPQPAQNVNLGGAYDPVNNQVISYGQVDLDNIQKAYQQYGDSFYDHLSHDEQVIYDDLLDKAPRRADNTYIDPITGEVVIDEVIKRDDGSKYVRIDNNIIEGIDSKPAMQKAVKNHIRNNFQGNSYDVGETGESAKVTARTKNEIAHQQRLMSDIDYKLKARMAGNLNEVIETMQDVRVVPNHKPEVKPKVSHYLSGRTEVEVDGELYYPRVDIEVGHKGNMIAYDIADIRKAPGRGSDSSKSSLKMIDNQGLYDSNIAQAPENVNSDIAMAKKLRQEVLEAFDDYKNVKDWITIKTKISGSDWYSGADINNQRSVYEYQVPAEVADKAEQLSAIRKKYQGDVNFPFDDTKTPYRIKRLADHPHGISTTSRLPIYETYEYDGVPQADEDIRAEIAEQSRLRMAEIARNKAELEAREKAINENTEKIKHIKTIIINQESNKFVKPGEYRLVPDPNNQSIAFLVKDGSNKKYAQMSYKSMAQRVVDGMWELPVSNINPDIKTKLSNATNQLKSSIDELKSRHFKLTGDNDIAFNAFAEAIQDIGNIEGYYDPKTNTVHIGELAEYVLNHEVVHKTLRKHMELRPEIMQATADKFGIDNIIAEYNQKGYGEQAVNGHALDPKQPKDVRLAVEEKVADEFNTYLDQYQKGRANYYANKVGLSPTIRAWFDRIIEGLKEFFGQADKIKQFYAQLETGKFADRQLFGNSEQLSPQVAYRIYQTPAGKVVEIEGNPLKGVPIQQIPAKVRQIIKERFQGREYNIGDTDQTAKVTARSKNEIAYQQNKMSNEQYRTKAMSAHQLDELISSMENVHTTPNRKKATKPDVVSYTYGDVTVKIGDRFYDALVNVENWKSGKSIIYDISNIKETPPQRQTLLMGGGVHASSVAQDPNNVKYLIGGEQATGFVSANNLYGGLDGRTKFEFDDSKAEWSFSKDQKPSTGEKSLYKLGDIFSHDELYKQYPEAKDITVRFVNRPRSRAGGHVSEVDNLIEVNWGCLIRSVEVR